MLSAAKSRFEIRFQKKIRVSKARTAVRPGAFGTLWRLRLKRTAEQGGTTKG
jgi:hypothetical protein